MASVKTLLLFNFKAKNEELTNKLRTLSKLNEALSEDLNKVKMNLSSLLKTSRFVITKFQSNQETGLNTVLYF
jgi:hypothetical protein